MKRSAPCPISRCRHYAGEDYYDPQDTERHVFRAIRGECADRLQMWETNVLTAIDQFETDAYMHITELEYEHPVEFPFGPVVRSFADVAISFFPPTRSVRSIVSGVMGGIQADYDGQLETSLSGANRSSPIRPRIWSV